MKTKKKVFECKKDCDLKLESVSYGCNHCIKKIMIKPPAKMLKQIERIINL